MQTLFVYSQKNPKTGPVVGAYHGATRAESLKSCKGCPYLADKTCYAHWKGPSWSHTSMIKAKARGKDYSFGASIRNATSKKGILKARAVRLGVIGEPSAMNKKQFEASRKFADDSGIPLLCYTHFRREGERREWLKGQSMASVDSLAEADEATAQGWRAAIKLPASEKERVQYTPAGDRAIVCPHQTRGIQCADCGLCDGRKKAAHIILWEH